MYLLFAAMCLGHLVLLVGSHNWWYGLHLPRHSGDFVHLVHLLLFLALPVVVLALWGPDLPALLVSLTSPAPLTLETVGRWALAGYIVLCWGMLGIGFPTITARRLLRKEPVREKRSEVVNVAARLGYRPVGTDKYRFLTYLPGNEAFQVEFSEKTLCPPRLPPEWDGLTILHLSDLHLKGTPDRDYYRFIMDRCADWEPDIVAVTGDIADSWRHQRWIVPVLGRLRWRVAAFAILGNHDYWYDPPFIRRRLRRVRMNVLSNSWQEITVRGRPLVVVGQEYPWLQPLPDLSGCPQADGGPFRLCLSHTPDNIAWARRNGMDLVLAGHVHGGQIRFPLIGSVFVPSRLGRAHDGGTYEEGRTILHVSRGLSGEQQIRYLCRPEATLLRLRSPA
jgi:predicted MPP superfamily phosphohydrolase